MVENTTQINMNDIYDSYKNLKTQLNEAKEDGDKEKWQHYAPFLIKIQEFVSSLSKDHSDYMKVVTMLASLYYEQARLLISNGNLETSLENLNLAIQVMKDFKQDPQIVYIYLRVVNLYSYIQSKNGNLEVAKTILLDAEKLYYGIEEKENTLVFNTDELFKLTPENNIHNLQKLEKLVTNNLQMLGWIYNKQNLQDIFVKYHHTVLRRQLEHRDGNALTWVLKCARLSSYFLSKQRFREARHHLAAALVVLQEYEKEVRDYHGETNFLEEWEELQHYYADVSRYWVKYGLFLFNASRSHQYYLAHQINNKNIEKIINGSDNKNEKSAEDEHTTEKEDDKVNEDINADKKDANQNQSDEELLLFPTLDLEVIENQVTDKYIQTTEQARSLFLQSQTWLKRSKQFYTIHEYTLDYVNAILDLSELYRYLAYYESDIDSQYNVQKRRADVLETLSNILRDVRPQCYIAVSIDLFRELAEVQMELLALNMQKLYNIKPEAASQNFSMVQDYNSRKMEALLYIHGQLETFHDRVKFKKSC